MKALTKHLVESTYELFMSQDKVLTHTCYYDMMFNESNTASQQRYAVANFIQYFSFVSALILKRVHEDYSLFDKLHTAYCRMMRELISDSF